MLPNQRPFWLIKEQLTHEKIMSELFIFKSLLDEGYFIKSFSF
jgi:hypothetical protein